MKDKMYDEWIKINVELHNKLETLKKLDEEREILFQKFKNNQLSEEDKMVLNDSLKKYSDLLDEVKKLNDKSDELRKLIMG